MTFFESRECPLDKSPDPVITGKRYFLLTMIKTWKTLEEYMLHVVVPAMAVKYRYGEEEAFSPSL